MIFISTYLNDIDREQMEAAGYGVHHISDDRKYLIIGNGKWHTSLCRGSGATEKGQYSPYC
ncbi:MAG: hypothetical protein ACLVE8_00160 [Blautia stercoris]